MEDIIRQAIKEFDYPECTIFKQLVQTIAPVEKVTDLELFLCFFFVYLFVCFLLIALSKMPYKKWTGTKWYIRRGCVVGVLDKLVRVVRFKT